MKAVVALLLMTAAASAGTPGVESEARAKMNWLLSCQGCHQPDASGSAGGAPSMVGDVARFLSVEGGREYLTRVPGVANAGLSDDQLAELLNWTLATFDKDHLPADFAPYTKEELAVGRARPLVSEAPLLREALRKKFPAVRTAAGGRGED
jgi:mono/diheme cytochrome c family protein